MAICQRIQRDIFLAPFVVIAGCSGAQNEYAAPPPPPVTVAKPIVRTVPIYIEENGETEAVERAVVSARVTGFLDDILFEPSQEVESGDQLYLIEQAQYLATEGSANATLDAAIAAIEVATAQEGTLQVELERANKEFDRQKELKLEDATTQQAYDTAEAAANAAAAQVAAAQAGITAAEADRNRAERDVEQAVLNLEYTEVAAPIDGYVTATEVKEGNLVQEGTPLATIVNRQAIYANFNISDRDALRLQRAAIEARGGQPPEDRLNYKTFPVQLQREIDDSFVFEGNLDYIDEEGVDQATGTLAMRAWFKNEDDLIHPGLFVRLRIPIARLEDAILIPESAVARDPQGSYVQVLDDDGTLARRNIDTVMVVDATSPDPTPEDAEATSIVRMVVVEQGLTTEDQVVIVGGFGIRPGMEVEATVEPLEGIEVPQVDLPFLEADSADQTDDATSE